MNKKIKNYKLLIPSSKEESFTEEDFKLVGINNELETIDSSNKNSSYLIDSFKKFFKNKASVVASFILLIIILYAIFTPLTSPFSYAKVRSSDEIRYRDCLPKLKIFEGTSFYDGTEVKTINDSQYYLYKYYDSKLKPITNDFGIIKDDKDDITIQRLHNVRIDTYAIGSSLLNIKEEEYFDIIQYEKENSLTIIQPLVDYDSWLQEYKQILTNSKFHYNPVFIENIIDNLRTEYSNNANISYKLTCLSDEDGYIINPNVYIPYFENESIISIYKDKETNDNGVLVNAKVSNNNYKVRVDFSEYYKYKYGFTPNFIFGSNSAGQDLFLRLAKGTLFSLLLGIIVASINFILGLIYGALEGFYGGRVDLTMSTFSDILSAIPGTIILVIFNIYFLNLPWLTNSLALVLGLFVAYILTGWIGVSKTARMQFYRYKNQEYVLASHSLGAKNKHLIFSHILPNAIGTIITSSILMIPGVIFSESSLSYLGIIDFSSSNICSIGQLLNEGRATLGTSYYYLLLFPSILVSLLMITFNLFGNGLRDAFNTSLQESEER